MKTNKTILAAAVGAVLLGALGTANAAWVIGQAYLDIDNFTITPTGPGGSVLAATNTGDTSATLGGTNDNDDANKTSVTPPLFAGIDIAGIDSCVGACAGYPVPGAGVAITTTTPATQFVGSQATVTGSALAPAGAEPLTDNSGVLVDTNTSGTAQSNLGLNTVFTVLPADGEFALIFSFTADQFLRAAISADAAFGSDSQVATGWELLISDATGATVFRWAPDGACGGISGIGAVACAEAYDLSTTLGTGIPGADTYPGYGVKSGAFLLETDVIEPGTYTLTVRQEGAIDVTLVQRVPEPGSIALLGLGLMGLGYMRRRLAA